MVKFLIDRPIATTVTFIAFLILSISAYNLVPISLMPNIAISEIIVKFNVPNESARLIEEHYTSNIRHHLKSTTHLSNIESESHNGQALLKLKFDYNTNIDYAYLEVNEKIDALMHHMPKEFKRPRAIKSNATDIPVFNLDVSLKDSLSEDYFLELSNFTDQIIKRRLEQLPEIAMVDISGIKYPEIIIKTDFEKLEQYNINQQTFTNTLNAHNYTIGNIKVRDGNYQFTVRYSTLLKDKNDLLNLPILIDKRLFHLKDFATIKIVPDNHAGYCLSNNRKSISMGIIKKSNAKIEDLKAQTNNLIHDLKTTYPRINFDISQDQTELLDHSISNLKNGLIFGILVAFLLMFIFLKDLKSPILIGISVPVSLVISILLFYLFNLSINIISLSGLILGVGMMIDNSIIVIDNITQHYEKTKKIKISAIKGTNEVIKPLISSVLTTCAVFVPLIFLNGISGALFYDQAIAVAIGLFVSLTVSFTIIPVYYTLFHKQNYLTRIKIPCKIAFYSDLENYYSKSYNFFYDHKKSFIGIIVIILAVGFYLAQIIDKEKFPNHNNHEVIVDIDWNENLSAEGNLKRTQALSHKIMIDTNYISAKVGMQSFLINDNKHMDNNQTQLYIKSNSKKLLRDQLDTIYDYCERSYPKAIVITKKPETIFDKMFTDDKHNFQIQLSTKNGQCPQPDSISQLISSWNADSNNLLVHNLPPIQKYFSIDPLFENLHLYDVEVNSLIVELQKAFNRLEIFSLKQNQVQTPIILSGKEKNFYSIINDLKVKSRKGAKIPVKLLVNVKILNDFKTFYGDKTKTYLPIDNNIDRSNYNEVLNQTDQFLSKHSNLKYNFTGSIFSTNKLFYQLLVILIISTFLLYLILAAQFESLKLPLIILLEIPIDIAGAFIVLYFANQTLNIMAFIGLIVMTGIIINDSILKIDTINKNVLKGLNLKTAIHEAGKRRLKPIVMTSLTTIIAMTPFLFASDMGSSLQKPLAWTIIGGISVGTFISLYFIPICYYYLKRNDQYKQS